MEAVIHASCIYIIYDEIMYIFITLSKSIAYTLHLAVIKILRESQ